MLPPYCGKRWLRCGRVRRESIVNDKLRVLVRLDLDCGEAEVAAQGHVTAQSLQALYVVVKRANHLRKGLRLVVDVSHANVEPAAMEQLQASSKCQHLPASIDPFQSRCNLRIRPPVASAAEDRPRRRVRAMMPLAA